LNERQNRYTNPAALEYFYKFYELVSKYYNQLVQYRSDRAHEAEASQRNRLERDSIVKDTSLSPELRSSKLAELWDRKTGESNVSTVLASDIDETVQSLRNLTALKFTAK
jgi:hypothetical protein